MNIVGNKVTVDGATGIVSCTLGRWYPGHTTCVVVVTPDHEVDVLCDGVSVDDLEERDTAIRVALLSITAFFMGQR